jgi:superkiller protein 8
MVCFPSQSSFTEFLSNNTQSKQYLTLHTVESAHPNASDVFAVAPTSTQLLSASGSSSINVYDTTQPDFPVIQTLEKAHPLGIHHLVTAREASAKRAASAGFEGKVKVWSQGEDGMWSEDGEIVGGYASCFHCACRSQDGFRLQEQC